MHEDRRMGTVQEHEDGLARFIEQGHRSRFRESLLNEKLKVKLRQKLAHFDWLDVRYAVEVGPTDAAQLASTLRAHGAPRVCFVLSEDADLDGPALPLDDALASVFASDVGAIISCVPGQLALYHAEPPDPMLLLRRKP